MAKKSGNIFQLHPKNQNSNCSLTDTCPMHNSINDLEHEPIAAIYMLITAAGEVVRGMKDVRKNDVAVLTIELGKLEYELHNFYNKCMQQEIKDRTGLRFESSIPEVN